MIHGQNLARVFFPGAVAVEGREKPRIRPGRVLIDVFKLGPRVPLAPRSQVADYLKLARRLVMRGEK